MQPFDKHQANAGELEACGSALLASVGQSISNGTATHTAYQPAITNWNGMCAPEVAAAPGPFDLNAAQTRMALAWAAVVTRYWGSQVETFNNQVDSIVAEMESQGPTYGAEGTNGEPPTDAQIASAKQAVEAAARRKWYTAYETYIVEGQSRATAMLQEGPTAENIRAAVASGALDQPAGFPDHLWNALKGNVLPPASGELGAFTVGSWMAGRGLTGLGIGTNWMTTVQLGRFAPRDALGRYISPSTLNWWQRGVAGAQGRNWQALPYQSATRNRWATAGKWGGRFGTVLTAGTAGVGQWVADSGRSDLSGGERGTRAAYRGVGVAAGAWGGAKLGAMGGAAIGTAIAPGVGTVIGGVVGGVVGGVAGSAAGNWIVDHTIEPVGEAGGWVVDKVGDGLSWTGDRISEGWDAATDFADDALDTVGDGISAINPFD